LVNRQEFNRLMEAQLAANQYQTYMTFDSKGGATLLGWPVKFSAEMPVYSTSPSTTGAWLFGSFEDFAIIGDRGGSNLHLKVDPYTGTLSGVTYIVGYRRTDQRVLLTEACVQLNTNG
jgi:HK97 family phage major capsid protein